MTKPAVYINSNVHDIELLQSNPNGLIIKYQPVIKTVVLKYVRLGFLKYDNKDDFIQYVNEELLNKIYTIQQQYNGKALFKTYLSVIIRNLCIQKNKKDSLYQNQEITENDMQVNYEDTLTGIIIEHEIDRFDKILKLFFKQRQKLELCLKLAYKVPITMHDLKTFCPYFEESYYEDLLKKLKTIATLTEKDIYQIVTPFLNRCENKDNTADATRKWIKIKIEELIKLMNGAPQRASYNEETLQILIEKYYNFKQYN